MNRFEKSHKFRKFGKLLKYDFLESFASILLINGVLLVLMLISKVVITDGLMWNNALLAFMLSLIISVGYLLSFVFLTITIIKLLYNRIFTPDGYLTFALPVSLDAILISKILVSSSYVVISSIMSLIWVLLISQIFENRDLFNVDISLNTIFWAINSIVGVISMNVLMLLILAILNIGIIVRFKMLCGIALFMVFMIIESVVYGIAFGNVAESTGFAIITLIFGVCKVSIYYLAARYLIANKLEI